MVEPIERAHGHVLAAAVAEWYLRTEMRSGSAAQRMPARERFGISNERLLRVLADMEAHLEEPASKEKLAEVARRLLAHLGHVAPADALRYQAADI